MSWTKLDGTKGPVEVGSQSSARTLACSVPASPEERGRHQSGPAEKIYPRPQVADHHICEGGDEASVPEAPAPTGTEDLRRGW